MPHPENSLALRREDAAPRAVPERPAARSGPEGDLFAVTSGIAAGREEAFNRFYRSYFDRIHRYLLVVSKGWEEAANEALQETMIRVIRHMKPFGDSGDLWNWLRSVARSALIDQVRKKKRAGAAVSLDALETGLAEETAEEVVEDPSAELKAHLAGALKDLNPADRRLVEGKYFDGKTYEDLARELDITAKAVESRLARIRKKLKTMILEGMEK